jgi:hypothetical protein
MSNNTSFLTLPAELRLQIYTDLAIPLHTPFSAYHGLYLSCRQIRTEIDIYCGPLYAKYLSRELSMLEWASFELPPTFLQMHHLHITIHSNYTVDWNCHEYDYFMQLDGLFRLYLGSLTVALHPELRDAENLVLQILAGKKRGELNASRVVGVMPRMMRSDERFFHVVVEAMDLGRVEVRWAERGIEDVET